MLYRKNVPGPERAARVIAGLATLGVGLSGIVNPAVGYGLAAAGVVALATGFVGVCPMCAMLGRGPVRPSAGDRA